MMPISWSRKTMTTSKARFLLRYGVVGVANTAAGNLVFFVAWNTIGSLIGYLPTSAISFLISVIISFWMQASYVFKVRSEKTARLGKYLVVQVVNLAVFVFALELLRGTLGVGPYSSYFLGSLLVIFLGFMANLRWVFHLRGTEDERR